MPGTYQYDVEIKSNVAKLLSDMKQVQDRLDTVEGKEYKIKLNVDEKKLSSVISNLEKMLDSLGKGTGDFKQLESLSKELSTITTEVQSLSKAFGKVDDSGAKTLLSSIQNIDRSLSELSQNILNVNKNMGDIGGNTNGAVKQVENITKASKEATSALEGVAKAQEEVSNANFSKYDNRLESYNKKTSGYDATIARFEDGGWTSDTYLKNVKAVKDAVTEYERILNNLKDHPELVTEEGLNDLAKQEKLIKENITAVQNMSAAEKGFTKLSAQKELDKINNILKEHSGMSREAKNQIKAYYAQIKSGNPSASLDVIHAEIMKIVNAEVEAGRAGKSMFDAIKEKAWYGVASAIGTYFGINDIFRYVGQGVNTIRELDEAMTEVRKVSEGTEAQYKSFQQTVSATAKEIASTNKELLNSSADFLRLGYNLEQAESLAKNATLFVNVGDGVDITEATEDMITAMKAFDIKAEDSIKIVDDYNQIGNKFALSATDIGEAMKRSASALETGNNSFEESIALITAMNEIVQSSENTGNTLKVFSLRLRGAKAELEDMGEDTDGLCESSSKLREQLQALTGVDIMLDDNTFKSTTQIVKELGAAWSKLSDSSQAATLELVAGKTRANNVAALLKNYKQIDNVLESLGEAEGSALRENDAIVDSINGRIKILSASIENFWQTAIDDSVIKNGVSALTSLVEGATNLVDTFGLLPPILTAVSAALSIKNVGRDKMYSLTCFEYADNIHNLLWIHKFRVCYP